MADLAEHLTRTERDQSFPYLRPKDAATIILIDRSGVEPKVLMGRRHHGHKFMPGKFVFPGGRVEAHDRYVPVGGELDPSVESRLMQRLRRPSRIRARVLAVAAIREASEETGLLLGTKVASVPKFPDGWNAFAEAGVQPSLDELHFIARAITPPHRPRRFDTRFFAADARAIAHRVEGIIGPMPSSSSSSGCPSRRQRSSTCRASPTSCWSISRPGSPRGSGTTCRFPIIAW